MKLSCALVACNDNPHYLDFWPIVKKAWWDIVGIPCIMIYVAETIPDSLKADPAVIHFQPIQGWPTATQAQVIRLLYPALLKTDGAVMLSDMDMIPMQAKFFHDGFASFQPDQFVSLRGIDDAQRQIYICYVGATPQTWRDLFGIRTLEDIKILMSQWAKHNPADGHYDGIGWCLDQQILYLVIKTWQEQNPYRIGLLPWTSRIPRLDRGNPEEWLHYSQTLHNNIQANLYIDFHMPPYKNFKQQIDQIQSVASLCI
jgi:hypothetical protein